MEEVSEEDLDEIEQIDGALPTAGHSQMYNMHKFFGRKQEDVIQEYIKNYTSQGEVVLDPFCGSGVMIGEALKLGRRAIGIDLNPVATFVSRQTMSYVDLQTIIDEFNKIREELQTETDGLYMTSCRKCKDTSLPAVCFTWKDGKPFDVRYECPHHGQLISPVNKEDIGLLKKIDAGKIEGFFDKKGKPRFWYPTERLYYSDGTPFLKKERFESVDEIFTRRNIIALSRLLDRIQGISNARVRDAFKFAFSSMTHLASKMTPVRPSRPFSSAWVQQSYWHCDFNMESNVWDLFRRAVLDKQGLVKAKGDIPDSLRDKSEASNLADFYKKDKDYVLITGAAFDVLDDLDKESIDYVITDPPYGHSIQYGELLFMWGCWLKLMDGFDNVAKEEIIENPRQRKTEKEYEHMLYVAFRRVHDVLKPGGYCTITFHNPELKYRNILFRSVVMAGFEFEKIVYQPPPRPSAKSLLQPFGSLTGDYFFRFRKPAEMRKEKYGTIDERRVEVLIVDITKKIIAERGEPTPYMFIQNSIDPLLYEELRKYGLLMDFDPKSVERTLKQHVGDVFQLVDVIIGKKGQTTLTGKAWWFANPSEHRLDIPLDKRIDEAISNLLMRQRKVTFTEVLTEVYTRFQNSLTPEQTTIMEILKENAVQIPGGKWEIRPFIEKMHEKHEEMVYYLARLGSKAGFDVDIAKDEYGKSYEGKRMDQALKLKKVKLPGILKDQAERVRSIDVIWHDGTEIEAEFEVEHSTSIIDALVRGANIKSNKIKRVIIVPSAREDLVYRRFKEPGIQMMMKDMEWSMATYESLTAFFENSKSASHINPDKFLAITRKPASKKERAAKHQRTLD